MRYILLTIAAVLFFFPDVFAQTNSPQQGKKTPLPRLKLREYTITGLAKVVLPVKERRAAPVKLSLRWLENPATNGGKAPTAKLKFHRPRPFTGAGSRIPTMRLRGFFGSFRTGGFRFDARTGIQKTMPYVSLGYRQSDGHVPFDQAEYRRFFVEGGIQQALNGGGRINIRTRYHRDRQHLWGVFYPLFLNRQTLTKKWEGALEFQKPLADHFSLKLSGNLRFNDHLNFFSYNQDRFLIRGRLQYGPGGSGLELSGGYERVNTERKELTLRPPLLFSIPLGPLWRTELSLVDARFRGRWRYGPAAFALGVTGQSLETLNTAAGVQKVYPFAELSLGDRSRFFLSIRYDPETKILPLGDFLSAVPYADLETYTFTRYRQRATASLGAAFPGNLRLFVESSYAKAKSFPVPVPLIGFPGREWDYVAVGEARFWQNSIRLDARPSKKIFITGWLILQSTEVTQAGDTFLFLPGKDLPYRPTVSASGEAGWQLIPALRAKIGVQYVGDRYNGVNERERVDSYFLLSAEIRLTLARNISLVVYGKNLLDENYQEYFGLKMPGVRGGGSLELGF